ncbi:PilN domain-containing protein [Desulfovibrio inopinatus]|uniref:PilN domain-containing protein n=1 Tax=Desulfovibrio inopinatus TaxID=102109 RepID=UPI00041E5841|nr:PilN domain-containing protein [Desulfovibrio inopinatus]
MATITLGLELGPTHVRAVALSSTLRETTLAFADSRPLPREYDHEFLAETAATLIQSAGFAPDVIVAGLPLRDVFMRRFTFPFSSTNKIRQVLPFELEPTLPWSLEDVVYSFQKGPHTEQGQLVLCAIVLKSTLAAYLGALNAKGIDPDIIDISASGLNALAKQLTGVLSPTPLFLHIQHGETLLHVQRDMTPVLFRTLPAGIDGLISEDGSSAIDISKAGQLHESETLAQGIQLSLLSAREEKDAPPPDMVVVTGRAALSKPALQTLSSLIEHSIVVVDGYPPGIAASIDGIDPAVAENALALGLACRGSHKGEGFDFRVAEFGRLGTSLSWEKEAIIIGACFVVVLLAWISSVVVDISLKRQRLNTYNTEIAASFKRVLPDLGTGYTDRQRLSILRNHVAELQNSGASNSDGPIKVVDMLGRISRALPENMDVTVESLNISQQTARLNALTTTFNDVQAIKKNLIDSGGFEDVDIRDSKIGAGGQGVEFVMEMDLTKLRTLSPPSPAPASPQNLDTEGSASFPPLDDTLPPPSTTKPKTSSPSGATRSYTPDDFPPPSGPSDNAFVPSTPTARVGGDTP